MYKSYTHNVRKHHSTFMLCHVWRSLHIQWTAETLTSSIRLKAYLLLKKQIFLFRRRFILEACPSSVYFFIFNILSCISPHFLSFLMLSDFFFFSFRIYSANRKMDSFLCCSVPYQSRLHQTFSSSSFLALPQSSWIYQRGTLVYGRINVDGI